MEFIKIIIDRETLNKLNRKKN